MLERLAAVAGPKDPDATLWRFMDFTKYVSMLHQRALFFTRADQLPDPFEGLMARKNHRSRERHDHDLRVKQRVYLSCWHHNEHESAAMWRIYLSSEDGVAIKSSATRLERALAGTAETVHLGMVRYLDYQRDQVPEQHELDPFFCKRRSFDYERELRVLWHADRDLDEPGRYLAADLAQLIEQVVISPGGEPWFERLVRSVTEKYGYDLPITRSSMLDDPCPAS